MTDRAPGYHAALGSPSRRQVLDALRLSADPLDATAVAARVGLHVTTARFHLDQLEAAGLIHRGSAPERRRGRPRVLYAPTGAGRNEDARDQMIDVLAAALADGGDATHAGHRWAADFEPPDAVDPAPGLVGILDSLGFDPEHEAGVIRLPSCPFRDAARRHPDVVCAVHRGLVERLTESTTAPARLLPFVEPELCLVALERQPA